MTTVTADAIVFLILFLGVFGSPVVALYVIPTIVGFRNKVPNLRSVIAVNILLGWTVVGWFVALSMASKPRPGALQADSEAVETPPTAEPTATEAPPAAALMPSRKVGKRRWRLYLGVSTGVTLLALMALMLVDVAANWHGHRNANGTWTDPWRETCAMNRTFMNMDDRWCETGHRNADGTWTDYVGVTCAINRTYMFKKKARVCS